MNHHLPAEPRPRVLDLFCGAGGFAEGFRLAGFHIAAGNDVDAWAGATFDLNQSAHGTRFVLGDITDPEIQAQLFDAVGPAPVDVVIGGPPCQAFSQVRNHQRIIDDPRNRLYRAFVAIVGRLRPKVFVMENVPGLENIADGRIREQVLADLGLDGEYVVQSRVVDAADYGVPQTRLRVLFVGVRADLHVTPRFPASRGVTNRLKLVREEGGRSTGSERERYLWGYRLASTQMALGEQLALPLRSDSEEQDAAGAEIGGGQMAALEQLLDPECLALVTVSQAIADLTYLTPSPKLVRKPSDDLLPYEREPTSAYQRARRRHSAALANADVPSIREDTVRRLLALPPGGNYRDLPPDLSGRYLNGKKWGPETGRPTLSRKYYFAYRKLHPDYFSWTLNTKADCVYHYATPRALSVREFARLHSFNDTYHFMFGDRHSRYRQVGNAVPPLLAQAIAETVRAVLADCDRRTIREQSDVAPHPLLTAAESA